MFYVCFYSGNLKFTHVLTELEPFFGQLMVSDRPDVALFISVYCFFDFMFLDKWDHNGVCPWSITFHIIHKQYNTS